MPTNTDNKIDFTKHIPSSNIIIKSRLSENSIAKFNNNIRKLEKQLSSETKFLIVKLFLQLGEAEEYIGQSEESKRVMNYVDKNHISLLIQPKIKNYIEFKTKTSAEKYLREETSENDLYLFLEVGLFGIGIADLNNSNISEIENAIKNLPEAARIRAN